MLRYCLHCVPGGEDQQCPLGGGHDQFGHREGGSGGKSVGDCPRMSIEPRRGYDCYSKRALDNANVDTRELLLLAKPRQRGGS